MEDGITLAVSVWLLGGLFLDGYAHVYVIDTETEDFFTPWHGVIYAGLAALGAWIAWVGHRRRRPGPLLDWFPPSYRLALVGLGMFALGGMGDGVWHTIYGVEIGVDALLSPTHPVLLTGGHEQQAPPPDSRGAQSKTGNDTVGSRSTCSTSATSHVR